MSLGDFHPAVRRWFAEQLGEPTEAQRAGWPLIRSGRHALIAAPTGSGKTLAAFLCAIDGLLRQGDRLPDETQVLYVSPLKALSNDVRKNLERPLGEIREADPELGEIRVLVRTGDTPASERARMRRLPPHILVTTPESLYILLTSEGGRSMLSSVRTVIVDEIHALVRDKRGSHLALSLERLVALCGEVQRIGLSATQKPLEATGRFLVGVDRECELVDTGHLRQLDLGIEVPPSPLGAVCSHEVWEEIYDRMVELIGRHRTTLVFVNTRKMAERVSARLSERLGADLVTSHHGSLSTPRRLDAEQRLKAGSLRALVATASLELGIDIGDVDLVIQVGVTPSIATFLQRVGRAGHGVGRTPVGRLFPLTRDDLVCAAALLHSVRGGELDRTPQPGKPLDILAQQIVAACVGGSWPEDELFARLRLAWPYRDLERADFDAVVALHTAGRHALLHRDGVGGVLRATRRARITAVTSGGAIPDQADYQVVRHPDGAVVGSLHEDFAIEANAGDIFQLGNTSWRILRVERGVVRVADAEGLPPTLPFWLGEAPARTAELSRSVAEVRELAAEQGAGALLAELDLPAAAAEQIADYLRSARDALGAVPTTERIVMERFFDETGGMQLVVHAPFGGRINRAFGLALRKRFCRRFGFELQAAANEEAFLLSLGPHHSFPLDEVAGYLRADTVRQVLVQALLAAPMFETRWRWNVTRALVVARQRGGKRVPAPLLRMRADDALAAAFPASVACAENLPAGDLAVPMDHPLVRQTVDDCLTEAMDLDGLVGVLRGLEDGRIGCVCVDAPEPSVLAEGILSAQPYAFLDDAPLEERRTQAVLSRRTLAGPPPDVGELDPDAVRRVQEEAWPRPRDAEEVHEALLWMGYATRREAEEWGAWVDELLAAGRVVAEGDRLFAVEASREPVAVMQGRLEALGPVHEDDPVLARLEAAGVAVRVRWQGRQAWCNRRLLARIHRAMVERLRREVRPVPAARFLRFLACWQHVDPEHRLEGPEGVAEVLSQLAGFEVAVAAWERTVLPARVRDYRREWLDQLALSGRIAWGRLWGSSSCPIRTTPICFFPRQDLGAWLALAGRTAEREPAVRGAAAEVRDLLAERGAMFPLELEQAARLLPSQLELGLAELVSLGMVTCDSPAVLRQLLVPPSRRRHPVIAAGRWSLLRGAAPEPPGPEFAARRLLARYGVLFRRLARRERLPVPWRLLLRACRELELRGDLRGGRFVDGFDGEQYALPEAVRMLRRVRAEEGREAVRVAAADPLNLRGVLTPDERVAAGTRQWVEVG